MRRSTILSATVAVLLFRAVMEAAQQKSIDCDDIDSATRQRITQDLIAKFDLRPSIQLKFCTLPDQRNGFVRVRVSSLGLSQPFERELYLTRDKSVVFDLVL